MPRTTPAADHNAPDLLTDAALLERLRTGEDFAFDELIRMAGGRMLAVARRKMTKEDDAQDAVQDVFLSAFKSLDRFDGRSRLTTWLHRITVNACLMKLRSQRRRGGPERRIEDFMPTFLADGHQARPSASWKPDASDGIQRSEVRDLVRASINDLPDQYRTVLILRDIEEISTEETAEILGMTTSAVKTRLHRARQALLTLLNPHFSTAETS